MARKPDNPQTITIWGNPRKPVGESQYGNVTYRKWCEKERNRLNKSGDTVRIISNARGEIALSRQRATTVCPHCGKRFSQEAL